MKKLIVILLFITAFTLSCAGNNSSTQIAVPDGLAGVSVDAQGNLVIDAPIYIFDRDSEDPRIKPAEKDYNLEIEIINKFHRQTKRLITKIAVGTISGGRLTVTIPALEENNLHEISYSFFPEFIKSGDSIKIGSIDFNISKAALYLYANPQIEIFDEGKAFEYRRIKGDEYYFIYSEGDALISGIFTAGINSDTPDYEYFDIKLEKGWNSICFSYDYNESEKIVSVADKSKIIPSDAVWVLVF